MNSIRRDIEKRIVSSSQLILPRRNHECFDDEAAQDFLQAWRDLVDYYRNHDDIMINIEVVREYRDWKGIFGGLQYNEGLSAECKEQAAEAHAELELYLSEIVIAVGRRLYPQGR